MQPKTDGTCDGHKLLLRSICPLRPWGIEKIMVNQIQKLRVCDSNDMTIMDTIIPVDTRNNLANKDTHPYTPPMEIKCEKYPFLVQ